MEEKDYIGKTVSLKTKDGNEFTGIIDFIDVAKQLFALKKGKPFTFS